MPDLRSKESEFVAQVHESVSLHEKVGMKQKCAGFSRAIYESVSGDDFHRSTGQWNKLTRIIDRQNDRYREIIIDPRSGEILRHCDEPLSDHKNHGSAKHSVRMKPGKPENPSET